MSLIDKDTIAAISTPAGVGGIAVVRVSGPEALAMVNDAWKGVDLTKTLSHTVHLGKYFTTNGDILDEAVASVYKSPKSFTGEDVVEISVHGSEWIQREILHDLVKRGARIADPGEFTMRAFLNGKIDLAQAEGVADLIASSSKAAHDMAINQTRGSFSKEFNRLRDKLVEFASLLELELDFSEEDVEFADRTALISLLEELISKTGGLASSYSKGAVLKNGVPVVIAGVPNAGKSSLLNLLLNDNKAIVTDIPGTTRDLIEDTIEHRGILFRFFDTAGLRATADLVEGIGVEKAREAMEKAYIVVWIIDPTNNLHQQLKELDSFKNSHPDKNLILLINKSDLSDLHKTDIPTDKSLHDAISFSTFTRQGLDTLLTNLENFAKAGLNPETDVIVSNARHHQSLLKATEALLRVKQGLESGVPTDFLAQDIREATSHLSEITGSITSDTLLHSIFSRFCIGK